MDGECASPKPWLGSLALVTNVVAGTRSRASRVLAREGVLFPVHTDFLRRTGRNHPMERPKSCEFSGPRAR